GPERSQRTDIGTATHRICANIFLILKCRFKLSSLKHWSTDRPGRSTAKRCVRIVRYRCERWKKTFSHGGHGGHGGFLGAAFVDGGSGPGTSCQATSAPSLRDILQQALTSGACQTIPVSSGMPKP